MKIIYISNLCSKQAFEHIKRISNKCPSLCEQKYHYVLSKGFHQANGDKVLAVTALPVSRDTSSRVIVRMVDEEDEHVLYHYIPAVNLPIIKHIIQIITSFLACFVLCLKENETVFVCDMLCGSASIGARLAAKLFKREFTGIVTDIPCFYADNGRLSHADRILTYNIKRCNSYVLLTDAMNDYVNENKRKPYCVIEGQADFDVPEADLKLKSYPRVCLYAGAIEKLYGLDILVHAFQNLKLKGCQLHIYGVGNYVEELKEACKKCDNVRYLGVKNHEEIVEEERKATLLINPRPSGEEYTKYSFPSKTIEYMMSGTPVITTRLPGIPKEYYPYLYFIDEESTDGIVNSLKKIFSKSDKELFDFGVNAQKWVRTNKNCKCQAEKILEMWKRTKEQYVSG